jgi:diguanylate cyclase (GGDEF)-like protein
VWGFFACLMIMAATGIVLGTWYLRLSVLKPLALLCCHGKDLKARRTDTVLPTNRPDEIGTLAKLLSDLHRDVERWRRRATGLQDSFSDRVDTEIAKIARELRQAKHKVWIDPLTRLGNRRLLDDKFADIFRAQQDSGDDFALVMIDVDNFKTLNDMLGHKAGDELLRFVGELLPQCVRAGDLAIRFGGDEFALLLPGASARNAKTIAERMSRLFAQQAALLDVDPKPAVSVGVASLLDHRPDSPEDLIQMADLALYSAKRAGKAQVAIYTCDPEPAAVA